MNKVLSVVIVVAVVGATGALGYAVAIPEVGERFTEFYILGPSGKAEHYPEELRAGEEGRLIVGIVNHGQEWASYKMEVWIDGEKAKLRIEGEDSDSWKFALERGKKWEGEIGFVSQKAGKKQKAEFVLYKEGEPYFEDPPYFWVDIEDG